MILIFQCCCWSLLFNSFAIDTVRAACCCCCTERKRALQVCRCTIHNDDDDDNRWVRSHLLVDGSQPSKTISVQCAHVYLLNCSHACPFARVFLVHFATQHLVHINTGIRHTSWVQFYVFYEFFSLRKYAPILPFAELIKRYDGNRRLSGWTQTQIYAYKWVGLEFSSSKINLKNSFLVFFFFLFSFQ